MSYETEVAALTVAVNTLSSLAQTLDTTTQSAYNVAVATAQTHATTATNQVALATTQKTLAASSASSASSSASQATTQAGIATTQAAAATAAAVGASNIVLGVSTLYPTIRPSLDLDFANSQTVDPRITFTRASTATRTNARGLIEAVASGVPRIDFDAVTGACKGLLVEEQRTNLLTYSEQFDNAAWVKFATTITANATAAPDGTLTADLVLVDASNGAHGISQAVTGVVGLAYSISAYLKAGALTRCRLAGRLSANWAVFPAGVFDLTTGGIVSSSGDKTATIENVGGGWFRCTVYGTCATTNIGFDGGPVLTTTHNFDGAANPGGVYMWGAQLEAGAFPTTHQPSTETFTGRASTATFIGSNGLIQTASSGVARLGYNPLNLTVQPKLVLEAAGTNLLTYSEQFDNAVWTKTRATVTANATTAPDGSLTAYKLVEDTTATNTHHINVAGGLVTFSAVPYAASIFLKAGERTRANAYVVDSVGIVSGTLSTFDLVAGSVISGAQCAIQNVGLGWYRVTLLFTPAAGIVPSSGALRVMPNNGTTNSYTGDGTSGLYIWGAQLEASPFPTSYIPTVASAVTRVADTSTSAQTTRAADVASMTGANFSSWYRQDEGSFVAEVNQQSTATSFSGTVFSVSDGTNQEAIELYRRASDATMRLTIVDGGFNQAFANAGVTTVASLKTSISYKLNSCSITLNGAVPTTDTAATIPSVDQMRLGSIIGVGTTFTNGHLRSISYYPKALTSAELQALSTQ